MLLTAARNKPVMIVVDGGLTKGVVRSGTGGFKGLGKRIWGEWSERAAIRFLHEEGVYLELLQNFLRSGHFVDRMQGELLWMLGVNSKYRAQGEEYEAAAMVDVLTEADVQGQNRALQEAWVVHPLQKLQSTLLEYLGHSIRQALIHPQTMVLKEYVNTTDKRFEHALLRQAQLYETLGHLRKAFNVFHNRAVWAREMALLEKMDVDDRRFESAKADLVYMCERHGFDFDWKPY